MGFIETSYGSNPNLSQVNIDSNLNLGEYGITSDNGVDFNNSNLFGINKISCKDFFTDVILTESEYLGNTLILDDVSGANNFSKKIVVPNNVVSGSSLKLTFNVINSGSSQRAVNVYVGSTRVNYELIPANTSQTVTLSVSNIKGGDLIKFDTYASTLTFNGSQGVKLFYTATAVNSMIWDIED